MKKITALAVLLVLAIALQAQVFNQNATQKQYLLQQIKNDPYYHAQSDTDTVAHQTIDTALLFGGRYGSNINSSSAITTSDYSDPNEAKVYRKLAQLNTALNKASAPATDPYETSTYLPPTGTTVNTSDVDRLEAMMQP